MSTVRDHTARNAFIDAAHEAWRLAAAAKMVPVDSSERDQANADVVAAYVELGRALGLERILEERVAQHAGERVPEALDARADHFKQAAMRVLYDLGGLLPRILLTLAGALIALSEGRSARLLRPARRKRGEAGASSLVGNLQQTVALRILLEATLAGQTGFDWVEDTRPGTTGRTYQRWLATAALDDQVRVQTLADKMMQQTPLNPEERQLYDRITGRPLRQMFEGLAQLA